MSTKIAEHDIYGYTVVLFATSLYKAVPIFHRPYASDHRTPELHEHRTGCGRVHSRWRTRNDRTVPDYSFAVTHLDPRHAVRFARPCEVCYHGGIQERLEEDDAA
jgi:hypothetical protein